MPANEHFDSRIRDRFIFLFLIIFSFIFLFRPSSVLAQTQCDPKTSSSGCPIDSSNYKAPQNADFTLINLQHGLLCQLAGASPDGQGCIGQKVGSNGKILTLLYDRVPGNGAVGDLSNIMLAMYKNPPTSTTEYLASLGRSFGLVQPAYAQSVGGSGAGIIEPIRLLWQATRNLAYLAYIAIFLIVGLMIMFRQKINQQTVVSVQQALPGLVIGLILITFSYFIAAFIIDLSFLGVQLVAGIFSQVQVNGQTLNTYNIQDLAQSSNAFNLFVSSIRLPENIKDIFTGLSSTLGNAGLTYFTTTLMGALAGFLTAGPIGALVGGVGGLVAIPLVSLIVPLILIIILIIQFIRLMVELIKSYVALLIYTVAGPFYILAASLPGRGSALGGWWKCLLGNSLVFPAVFAAFLFAGMILATPITSWKGAPPLFGGLRTELLRFIIAYGLILGTPAIPKMVRKAIGCPDIVGIPEEAAAAVKTGREVGQEIGAYAGRRIVPRLYNRVYRANQSIQTAPWYLRPFSNRLGDIQGGLERQFGPRGGTNKNPWIEEKPKAQGGS